MQPGIALVPAAPASVGSYAKSLIIALRLRLRKLVSMTLKFKELLGIAAAPALGDLEETSVGKD